LAALLNGQRPTAQGTFAAPAAGTFASSANSRGDGGGVVYQTFFSLEASARVHLLYAFSAAES
jgi:hypothetical protein